MEAYFGQTGNSQQLSFSLGTELTVDDLEEHHFSASVPEIRQTDTGDVFLSEFHTIHTRDSDGNQRPCLMTFRRDSEHGRWTVSLNFLTGVEPDQAVMQSAQNDLNAKVTAYLRNRDFVSASGERIPVRDHNLFGNLVSVHYTPIPEPDPEPIVVQPVPMIAFSSEDDTEPEIEFETESEEETSRPFYNEGKMMSGATWLELLRERIMEFIEQVPYKPFIAAGAGVTIPLGCCLCLLCCIVLMIATILAICLPTSIYVIYKFLWSDTVTFDNLEITGLGTFANITAFNSTLHGIELEDAIMNSLVLDSLTVTDLTTLGSTSLWEVTSPNVISLPELEVTGELTSSSITSATLNATDKVTAVIVNGTSQVIGADISATTAQFTTVDATNMTATDSMDTVNMTVSGNLDADTTGNVTALTLDTLTVTTLLTSSGNTVCANLTSDNITSPLVYVNGDFTADVGTITTLTSPTGTITTLTSTDATIENLDVTTTATIQDLDVTANVDAATLTTSGLATMESATVTSTLTAGAIDTDSIVSDSANFDNVVVQVKIDVPTLNCTGTGTIATLESTEATISTATVSTATITDLTVEDSCTLGDATADSMDVSTTLSASHVDTYSTRTRLMTTDVLIATDEVEFSGTIESTAVATFSKLNATAFACDRSAFSGPMYFVDDLTSRALILDSSTPSSAAFYGARINRTEDTISLNGVPLTQLHSPVPVSEYSSVSSTTAGSYIGVATSYTGKPVIGAVRSSNAYLITCMDIQCNNTNTNGPIGTFTMSTGVRNIVPIPYGVDSFTSVFFIDSSSDAYIRTCDSLDCTSISAANQYAISTSAGGNLAATRIMVGTATKPLLVYYDTTSSLVKLVQCTTLTCSTRTELTAVDLSAGSPTTVAVEIEHVPGVGVLVAVSADTINTVELVACTTLSCSAVDAATSILTGLTGACKPVFGATPTGTPLIACGTGTTVRVARLDTSAEMSIDLAALGISLSGPFGVAFTNAPEISGPSGFTLALVDNTGSNLYVYGCYDPTCSANSGLIGVDSVADGTFVAQVGDAVMTKSTTTAYRVNAFR
ncbi:hypothetical protein J8273_3105 [Carpediemonas membranifera]|uniref:Uncharacterized protein n=1 Tax=Carpediemonas membranifera TaxID=201153 RepID=A0A8J6E0U0_9EUKA|nr:hypothetical protein J8273_3105 [Carpediemonas membranifera]|eukprot:KAG9395529.1 hypothetical protein J8273_3105 [Carpediemonas membranifera]